MSPRFYFEATLPFNIIMLMTCHRLPNAISFFLSIINVLFVNINQHKDINETEKQLTKDFSSICDWFVDDKLSIHFDENDTKSKFFIF